MGETNYIRGKAMENETYWVSLRHKGPRVPIEMRQLASQTLL